MAGLPRLRRPVAARRSWRASSPTTPRNPTLRASQTGEIWVRNGVRVNPCRHHRKPDGDIFVAQPGALRGQPVGGDAAARRCSTRSAASTKACRYARTTICGCGSALREPVGLLDEPLVIKRGGHADQLSRRYWGMDRFRVAALAKLLAADELGRSPRAAALATLRRKCAVLAQGARRRGRSDEAERYVALAGVRARAGRGAEADVGVRTVRAYAAEKRFERLRLLTRWLAQPPADRDALLGARRRSCAWARTSCATCSTTWPPSARGATAGIGRRAGRRRGARRAGAAGWVATRRSRRSSRRLRRLRYPQLSAAEQRLAELVRPLRLPAGVRVEPAREPGGRARSR